MVKARTKVEPARVIRSQRPDGRYLNPFWATYYRLKEHQPRLAFNSRLPAGEFAAWRTQVRQRLGELVGWDDLAIPPESQCLWTKPRDGYSLQKWEAYPEPYAVYPFYLLIPDGVSATQPAPAVLCGPGGTGGKEVVAGEPQPAGARKNRFPEHNAQARHFAQAGYVALTSDAGFGFEGEAADEAEPAERDAYFHELWLGRSLEAISVVYRLQLLRWLKTCQFIDAERIAVSAHSMSTTHLLMTALLEPAVKAVIFNDFIADWRERQVAQTLPSLGEIHLLPGMIKWFDYVDLLAALAPVPLLVTEGGRTRDLERVRQAYDRAGAPDHFTCHYYPRYALPENRPYDHIDLPDGLGGEDYFPYANVDVPNHYFKEDLAVPWLKSIFAKGGRG
jgi:dienelactone hydrolase